MAEACAREAVAVAQAAGIRLDVGQVAVQGEKYGVSTPVTRTVANLIRARESGYLPAV